MNPALRITGLRAVPISFPVPEHQSVRLGIGRSVKRDAVLVRVQPHGPACHTGAETCFFTSLYSNPTPYDERGHGLA